MTSAGETKPWITNLDGRVPGLEVVLVKQVIVLPWNQFLYAEGGDDEVRAVFTTHDVVAKGSGLASLLFGSGGAARHEAEGANSGRPVCKHYGLAHNRASRTQGGANWQLRVIVQ